MYYNPFLVVIIVANMNTDKGINITLLDAYLVAFKKLGQHDQRQLKASPISLFVLDGNGCEISVSKV